MGERRKKDVASGPLPVDLLPQIQESLEELDAQAWVQGSRRRANRMHAQLGEPGVCSPAAHGAGQGRADGPTASRIVADLEILGFGTDNLANPSEYGGRHGVCGHVAVGVAADGYADVQLRHVLVQVILQKVGVAGVGNVRGEEERLGVRLAEEPGPVGGWVEGLDGALNDNGEEVAAGALSKQGADFLIVEERDELDVAVVGVGVGGKETRQGGPGAELVVDSAGRDELPVHAQCLRGLAVVQLEFPVEDGGVARDAELLGDELHEPGRLGVDKGALGAERLGIMLGRALEADDGDGLRLLVVVAKHAHAKVRREGGDLGNRPVKLDELGGRLAGFGVANHDTAADAEVAIPPCLVEAAGVLGHAELHIACLAGPVADGLEARGEGIDVSADHGHAAAGLVGGADGEGDDGAAVAGDPVLASGVDFAIP